MNELLWLIPALPFAGFVVLAVLGGRLPRSVAAAAGVIPVALSMVLSLLIAREFIYLKAGSTYIQHLWTWMAVGTFAPAIGLYLDALSLVMVLVVTVVGFLILLYSTGFMAQSEGYSRFFAYMNLFVGAMLILVLADNLLLLYLGWEGVGLCSYLLIGFWYRDPANGRAAVKAFVVTRVGDVSMAVGLFLLFSSLGAMGIQQVMLKAQAEWAVGSGLAIAAAALLLGGALGKSAQLPLQTWLPDAMAGPTPVSALIHAATMVTAGVYLIARTHVLFTLAPPVLTAVAVIGAVTLLVAGASALTQRDIKRVLAYSTMSQVGYMFLALGVGAWSAAIFHFVTHACFKALLFLAAGVIIQGLDEEHDMFRMGGLRKVIPLTFWAFLVGAASLSALPLVTAGFYSKDLIITDALLSEHGGVWLWLAAVIGAFITSVYAFRMVFMTFFGETKGEFHGRPGVTMKAPLIILAVLSVVVGFLETPSGLGKVSLFSDFMKTVLPAVKILPGRSLSVLLEVGVPLVGVLGLACACLFFLGRSRLPARIAAPPFGSAVHQFWFSGWGFDRLYDLVLVRPFVVAATLNKDDFVDLAYRAIAGLAMIAGLVLPLTQTGKLRWYLAVMLFGAVLFIGIVVFR